MKGIQFNIPNEYNTYLNKIFKNVDLSSHFCYIQRAEVYDGKDDLFVKTRYSYKEFIDLTNSTHYAVFFNAQFNEQTPKILKEINNFEDFIKSDCFLSICIIDCTFVEIYCKDESVLLLIEKNVKENDFSDFKKLNFSIGIKKDII